MHLLVHAEMNRRYVHLFSQPTMKLLPTFISQLKCRRLLPPPRHVAREPGFVFILSMSPFDLITVCPFTSSLFFFPQPLIYSRLVKISFENNGLTKF